MSSIRNSVKRAVLARQHGLCAGTGPDGEPCGRHLETLQRNRAMHVYLPAGRVAVEFDHIVPRCDGGGDEPENLQALCGWCHYDKTELERPEWRGPAPSALAGAILGPGDAVTRGRRLSREAKGRRIGTRRGSRQRRRA